MFSTSYVFAILTQYISVKEPSYWLTPCRLCECTCGYEGTVEVIPSHKDSAVEVIAPTSSATIHIK